MTTTKTIKILLVEDHIMFSDGLTSLLKINTQVHSIQNVTNANDAYELITKTQFDLIITDVGLPGTSGIELTKKIKKYHENLPVLILSMHIGKELVKEILYAGAEGYLLKKAGKNELFSAIEKITNGGTYYGSEITVIMKELINVSQSNKNYGNNELTTREREVLQLICQEYSSREIADKLCIGNSTVETHRRSMFQKTNSKSVIGLIRYAVENNLAFWKGQ